MFCGIIEGRLLIERPLYTGGGGTEGGNFRAQLCSIELLALSTQATYAFLSDIPNPNASKMWNAYHFSDRQNSLLCCVVALILSSPIDVFALHIQVTKSTESKTLLRSICKLV
jgi:hypothetical protein